MNQGSVRDTTSYVNYVYNISSRGTAEVTSQLMGMSGMMSNVLGQLAFQTSSYLNSTEGALLSLSVIASAGLTKAIQKAMDFDNALRTVKAIAGDTDISQLGDQAMAMSNKFGVAVSDMTEGLESLARAGITDQSVMGQILEEAMKLSKLEGLDVNSAINSLISTTNLLDTEGLDSSTQEYADAVKKQNQMIVSTSEVAPINASDIIHTLEHVGGYAQSTNIDQEDLFAVIAQLGSKGTKSEMAGTSLRAFLAAGQKDQAQRALKRIGLSVQDLWKDDDTILSITDMKDVIDEAMEAKGYTQQEKLEFYSDFAGYKQANQIMKIDTDSARSYKKDIGEAWDLGRKMTEILGSAQTNVQSLMQTGINFLTKVGEPFLPIISTIAWTLKTMINIVDMIPFSNWIIAGGLLLISIKGISTVFNKIGPQLLAAKGNIGGISDLFKDIHSSLEESYKLLKNWNDPEFVRDKAQENEYKRITDDNRIDYLRSQGYSVDYNNLATIIKSLNDKDLDKKIFQFKKEKDAMSIAITKVVNDLEDNTAILNYNNGIKKRLSDNANLYTFSPSNNITGKDDDITNLLSSKEYDPTKHVIEKTGVMDTDLGPKIPYAVVRDMNKQEREQFKQTIKEMSQKTGVATPEKEQRNQRQKSQSKKKDSGISADQVQTFIKSMDIMQSIIEDDLLPQIDSIVDILANGIIKVQVVEEPPKPQKEAPLSRYNIPRDVLRTGPAISNNIPREVIDQHMNSFEDPYDRVKQAAREAKEEVEELEKARTRAAEINAEASDLRSGRKPLPVSHQMSAEQIVDEGLKNIPDYSYLNKERREKLHKQFLDNPKDRDHQIAYQKEKPGWTARENSRYIINRLKQTGRWEEAKKYLYLSENDIELDDMRPSQPKSITGTVNKELKEQALQNKEARKAFASSNIKIRNPENLTNTTQPQDEFNASALKNLLFDYGVDLNTAEGRAIKKELEKEFGAGLESALHSNFKLTGLSSEQLWNRANKILGKISYYRDSSIPRRLAMGDKNISEELPSAWTGIADPNKANPSVNPMDIGGNFIADTMKLFEIENMAQSSGYEFQGLTKNEMYAIMDWLNEDFGIDYKDMVNTMIELGAERGEGSKFNKTPSKRGGANKLVGLNDDIFNMMLSQYLNYDAMPMDAAEAAEIFGFSEALDRAKTGVTVKTLKTHEMLTETQKNRDNLQKLPKSMPRIFDKEFKGRIETVRRKKVNDKELTPIEKIIDKYIVDPAKYIAQNPKVTEEERYEKAYKVFENTMFKSKVREKYPEFKGSDISRIRKLPEDKRTDEEKLKLEKYDKLVKLEKDQTYRRRYDNVNSSAFDDVNYSGDNQEIKFYNKEMTNATSGRTNALIKKFIEGYDDRDAYINDLINNFLDQDHMTKDRIALLSQELTKGLNEDYYYTVDDLKGENKQEALEDLKKGMRKLFETSHENIINTLTAINQSLADYDASLDEGTIAEFGFNNDLTRQDLKFLAEYMNLDTSNVNTKYEYAKLLANIPKDEEGNEIDKDGRRLRSVWEEGYGEEGQGKVIRDVKNKAEERLRHIYDSNIGRLLMDNSGKYINKENFSAVKESLGKLGIKGANKRSLLFNTFKMIEENGWSEDRVYERIKDAAGVTEFAHQPTLVNKDEKSYLTTNKHQLGEQTSPELMGAIERQDRSILGGGQSGGIIATEMRLLWQTLIEVAIQSGIESLGEVNPEEFKKNTKAGDIASAFKYLRAPAYLNKIMHTLLANDLEEADLYNTILQALEQKNSDLKANNVKMTGNVKGPHTQLEKLLFTGKKINKSYAGTENLAQMDENELLGGQGEGEGNYFMEPYKAEQDALKNLSPEEQMRRLADPERRKINNAINMLNGDQNKMAKMEAEIFEWKGQQVPIFRRYEATHGKDFEDIFYYDDEGNYAGVRQNVKGDYREAFTDAWEARRNRRYMQGQQLQVAASLGLQHGISGADILGARATESQKARAKELFEQQRNTEYGGVGFLSIDQYIQDYGQEAFLQLQGQMEAAYDIEKDKKLFHKWVTPEELADLAKRGLYDKEILDVRKDKDGNTSKLKIRNYEDLQYTEQDYLNQVKLQDMVQYQKYSKIYQEQFANKSYDEILDTFDYNDDNLSELVTALAIFDKEMYETLKRNAEHRGQVFSDNVIKQGIMSRGEAGKLINIRAAIAQERGINPEDVEDQEIEHAWEQYASEWEGEDYIPFNEIVTDEYGAIDYNAYQDELDELEYQADKIITEKGAAYQEAVKTMLDVNMELVNSVSELVDNSKTAVLMGNDKTKEQVDKERKGITKDQRKAYKIQEETEQEAYMRQHPELWLGAMFGEGDVITNAEDPFEAARVMGKAFNPESQNTKDLLIQAGVPEHLINHTMNNLQKPGMYPDTFVFDKIFDPEGYKKQSEEYKKNLELLPKPYTDVDTFHDQRSHEDRLHNRRVAEGRQYRLMKERQKDKKLLANLAEGDYAAGLALLPNVPTPEIEEPHILKEPEEEYVKEKSKKEKIIDAGKEIWNGEANGEEMANNFMTGIKNKADILVNAFNERNKSKLGLGTTGETGVTFGKKLLDPNEGIMGGVNSAKEKINKFSTGLENAQNFVGGLSSGFMKLSQAFPPLIVAVGVLEAVSWGLSFAQSVLEAVTWGLGAIETYREFVESGLTISEAMLAGETSMLDIAFGGLLVALAPLVVPIVAVTAAFVALVAILKWSNDAHKEYIQKLNEEQRSLRSQSGSLEQQTYTLTRQSAHVGNEAAKIRMTKQLELAEKKLIAIQQKRRANTINLALANRDAINGETGLWYKLSQIWGGGQSHIEEREGLYGRVQEATEWAEGDLFGLFTSDAVRTVADLKASSPFEFQALENYGTELQELYDYQSRAIKRTGSYEGAENDRAYQRRKQRIMNKTGLSSEEIDTLLADMQVDYQVTQAKESMDTQRSKVRAEHDLRKAANRMGVSPEELESMKGTQQYQQLMIQAQADMMQTEEYWTAVWETLQDIGMSVLTLLTTHFKILWDYYTFVTSVLDPEVWALWIKSVIWGTDGWKQEDLDKLNAPSEALADIEKQQNTARGAILNIGEDINYINDIGSQQYNDDLMNAANTIYDPMARNNFGNGPKNMYHLGGSGGRDMPGMNSQSTSGQTSGSSVNQNQLNLNYNSQQISSGNTAETQQNGTSASLARNQKNVVSAGTTKTPVSDNQRLNPKSSVIDDATTPSVGQVVEHKSTDNSRTDNSNTVTIQNININTADDPEAIKAMFLELIVELQEQINPRQVSRTVGEVSTETSTDANSSSTTSSNDATSSSSSQSSSNSRSSSSSTPQPSAAAIKRHRNNQTNTKTNSNSKQLENKWQNKNVAKKYDIVRKALYNGGK